MDLEKVFDRVPREVISWAMRKMGVEEWPVSAVMSMYAGEKTVVYACRPVCSFCSCVSCFVFFSRVLCFRMTTDCVFAFYK